jgi:hypothetical protein
VSRRNEPAPRVAALNVRTGRGPILALAAICCALLSGGCGVFRGIPTHGGGKRFDEEQRVVAGAVRRTLADMDLSELAGKKVTISLDCISQDGGGYITFPGLSTISAGMGGSFGTNNFAQINPPTEPGAPSIISNGFNQGGSANASATYNAQTSYVPSAMSSLPDVQYLRAALDMKCRHAGLALTAADPEVVLYVLVDVLGTNRSHSDTILVTSETLEASCECTYYALDPKTGKLLFEARRASSSSTYKETRHFGSAGAQVDRAIERTRPTPLPVDEPIKPTTQPTAIVKRKPWMVQMWDRLAGVGAD